MTSPVLLPALTPTQARQLWDSFSPRHRATIREKMDGDQMMLHQVLNRFKQMRVDPYAPSPDDVL